MESCEVLLYHSKFCPADGLAAKGRALADSLGGSLGILAPEDSGAAGQISADILYTLSVGDMELQPEMAAGILQQAIVQSGAKVVLLAATRTGNEIAARAAEALDAGCISECLSLEIEAGHLQAKRDIYGGIAVGCFVSETAVTVCTVANGALEEAVTGQPAAVEKLSLAPAPAMKEIVSTVPVEKSINLTKAKHIVSFGRGIAKQEDIAMVEKLAGAFDAEIGCSRPIAEELKWLSSEHQVGITGALVKPDLYMALGISGQVQHFAGMKGSKIIVAVNSNKQAPIFQFADYGIVGDVYKVVPALLDAMQA